MNTYLYAYLGSFALAALITPSVIWLARRIGAIDRPGIRTVHDRPIPRLGGVAIFVATMALIVSVVCLSDGLAEAFGAAKVQLIMLLSSATLVFLIGLADDLKGLSARTKFLLELLVAAVVCLGGLRITSITLTEGLTLSLGRWGYALTILWIVGLTNAVNLSDGLDGLAAGICSITCGAIALFAWLSGSVIMVVLMLALLGSLCGFLLFNFHPARVFVGDCGSLFLGFVIAASSVICVRSSAAVAALALPALALSVPILDTLFSMLRRLLERRSVFAPDRNHLHHRLLDLSLNQRRAVAIIHMVTLLATGLGLLMLAVNDVRSLFLFGATLLMVVFVFYIAGVVPAPAMLARLRRTDFKSRQQRGRPAVFEARQVQLRQLGDENQWWQDICRTAGQMGFAWVSLRTRPADGPIKEELWRPPGPQPDPSHMVIIQIPLKSGTPGRTVDLELAIARKGSLETTSRRATLLARLLDENEMLLATAVGS